MALAHPLPRRRRPRAARDARDAPTAAGRPGRATGHPGRRDARASGFARMAASAVVLGALVITGLLLGGFAGAVIVPAATCLFLVSNADLPALTESGFAMARLWRPRVLAGLLIAASICAAAGAHASQAGSGLAVTALLNGIPQAHLPDHRGSPGGRHHPFAARPALPAGEATLRSC